jgi:hypothetical protein
MMNLLRKRHDDPYARNSRQIVSTISLEFAHICSLPLSRYGPHYPDRLLSLS